MCWLTLLTISSKNLQNKIQCNELPKKNLCGNCTKFKCSVLQKYGMKEQLRDFCSTCYSWTRAHHKRDACVQVCRQSSSSPAGRPAFLLSALSVLFNGSCQVRCLGEPWVTASPPEEPPGFVEEQKFTSLGGFFLSICDTVRSVSCSG